LPGGTQKEKGFFKMKATENRTAQDGIVLEARELDEEGSRAHNGDFVMRDDRCRETGERANREWNTEETRGLFLEEEIRTIRQDTSKTKFSAHARSLYFKRSCWYERENTSVQFLWGKKQPHTK